LEAPQVALTVVTASAVGPGVFTMVAEVVKVHPLTSLTTTVYVPAANPVYEVVAVNTEPLTE
jgi:hypothetical protein